MPILDGAPHVANSVDRSPADKPLHCDRLQRGKVHGQPLVRRIVRLAPRRLRQGGMLLCEIGATQGDAACAMAGASGLREARILTDHEGLPRVLQAHL